MVAGICGGAEPLRADERLGHDEARIAVQNGEIRPLGEILAAIRERLPSEVVAVELKRDHGRLIYELKTVDAAGRRHEFHVDAASATISTNGEDD
ncbi:MAG: peptidase [Ancalomicrobiaceae bacterium]|nr:peptidase [Ancalomicrobiaceae bacterium]